MAISLALGVDWSVDSIDQDVVTKKFGCPFQLFSQTFCYPDRSLVIWMNQTDDVSFIEFVEGITQRAASTFGSVAFPPKLSTQCPTNLKGGPAGGIQEPNPTNEFSGRLFFDGPVTVAT